ncbi:restriction endonuclease subunit S [Franconibacter daqui]|uniref:restriction endonuclease subunit S n=1 Tax=Franconibacter daqui TaxID=2047724 RepID=UPI0030D1A582
MAKYKAYSEYKDSGVEWLGLMPKSWTICRLKNLATIKNGQDYKSVQADDGYPVMGSGGQFTFASKFMYDKPSVLLGRKGTIDKPLYINEPFWTVDTMYYTELNEGFDAKFLHYLALTIQFSRYSTNTALPSMTQEHLSNYKFSVPKAESERKKITEFLDLETAKIDNLIEKQQQLIELLKEKRQAVISHAVTKGLNPDVPMKDSGVEWLGKVPEHWCINSLNHVLAAIGDVDHYMPQSVDDGIPYVMTGDLTEFASGIEFSKCKQVNLRDYLKLSKKIKTCLGDVIMARYATIGTVSYVDIDKDFLVSYSCVTIKPNPSKVLGLYLCYYFKSNSFLQGIQYQVNTNTQGNVGINDLSKMKIVLPSIKEQEEIIAHLQMNLEQLDDLSTKSTQAINLIQERRTALISAAVTGKIDVRDWVAPETQDIEEPEEATV